MSVNIITYSSSPLKKIMPFFDIQDDIDIYDEKTLKDIKSLYSNELWFDCYIDLYNPKLEDPNYLHQFFIRIQELCNQIQMNQFTTIRILQNYSYRTSYSNLNKVFCLYTSLVNFFPKAYPIYSLLIPDILDDCYKYHPYNKIIHNPETLLWDMKSLFRVIHPHDIVHNLLTPLDKQTLAISGLKVGMLDLYNKVQRIFGMSIKSCDEAYIITIQDNIPIKVLSQIHYNLESICITQL